MLTDDGSDEHEFKVTFKNPEYTLIITISGITGGTLYVRNSVDLDPLAITANGTYAFTCRVTANE